ASPRPRPSTTTWRRRPSRRSRAARWSCSASATNGTSRAWPARWACRARASTAGWRFSASRGRGFPKASGDVPPEADGSGRAARHSHVSGGARAQRPLAALLRLHRVRGGDRDAGTAADLVALAVQHLGLLVLQADRVQRAQAGAAGRAHLAGLALVPGCQGLGRALGAGRAAGERRGAPGAAVVARPAA